MFPCWHWDRPSVARWIALMASVEWVVWRTRLVESSGTDWLRQSFYTSVSFFGFQRFFCCLWTSFSARGAFLLDQTSCIWGLESVSQAGFLSPSEVWNGQWVVCMHNSYHFFSSLLLAPFVQTSHFFCKQRNNCAKALLMRACFQNYLWLWEWLLFVPAVNGKNNALLPNPLLTKATLAPSPPPRG